MKDGQPTGAEGVIRAEDIQRELHGEAGGSIPLTPRQAAALARDKWPEEDAAPPGYTAGVAVVRTDRELATRRRDDPAEAWERVDDAKATAKKRENVASLYKEIAARAKKLVAKEEKLDAPSEAQRIQAEIDDARQALNAERARLGI